MAAIVDLSDGLGAVLDLGGTASGLGFLVSLLACAGLGVFALLQQDGSNDDDDSASADVTRSRYARRNARSQERARATTSTTQRTCSC